MDCFFIRGAGLLDMPLRVLDLLAQQGAAVSRAVIDQTGGDYCVLVEARTPRAPLIAEKIRSMVLVSAVEHIDQQEVEVAAELSPRSWRLADLGAKRELLVSGSGWGNMPRHLVEDDIAQGRLTILKLPEGSSVEYGLHALWRKDRLPGPATRWLLERFEAKL